MSAAERQARRRDRADAIEAHIKWLAGWVGRTLAELDKVEERQQRGEQVELFYVRVGLAEMQTRLDPSYLDNLATLRTKRRHERAEKA